MKPYTGYLKSSPHAWGGFTLNSIDKQLKSADTDWYKQRLTGLMFFVIMAFSVLILRLSYLQIFEGSEYHRLSENNCIRLQYIEPPRGLIYDRSGSLLVDNRPSYDLSIIPKDAKPLDQTLTKIAAHIDTPVEELKAKFEQNGVASAYRPVLIRQDINRDALAAIEVHRFDLNGVDINVRARRHYIHKQIAAHLIGYLSEINARELKSDRYADYRVGDYIGKYGIEKASEKYLRGHRGGRQVEVNAKGQVVRILKTVEAQPGNNVYLSIDYRLQQKAEELISQHVGAVAAMDPTNGQILALASSPTFDQNTFVSGMSHKEWDELISNPHRPMENKVTQAEYPPASTYKIVTAIAGLEEGVIDENTTFYCPGFHRYGDRIFKCWKKSGHGIVNVEKALSESCDVFFYQVGQKIGVDKLAHYAKACGLGRLTGIGLIPEEKGLIPTSSWKKRRFGSPWQGGETLSVAIGQGYNLVTPLQMLVLTAAVANNGNIFEPVLIHSVETSEGRAVFKAQKKIVGRLPASPKTLEIVKKGLWDVVNHPNGTGKMAYIDGIEVSGKTGTAQVIGRKKSDTLNPKDKLKYKPHAWFIAYAGSPTPKIAVVVIVEHGEHGSSAAAPIARELIKFFAFSNTEEIAAIH